MNNKEASINKVDELVNRAQLAINDWQCSGETYYLRQAQANLGSALELARAARTAVLAAEKAEVYSVGDDDMTFSLYDTPEEALKSARDNLTAGEIVAVIQWRESIWHPEISVEMLLGEFEEEACEDGGSASEYWSERIESEEMAKARAELEQRLNTVLKDWIDEHKLEADWYKPTGMKLSYQFDGKNFKRI